MVSAREAVLNEPSGHLTGCLHITHRIHLLWDMMIHTL